MALISRSLKLRRSEHLITGPASYATGGITFDPKAEGAMLSDAVAVLVNVESTTYEGYYNHTTGKIVMRVAATGAEVAGAVDLSAVSIRAVALY